MPAIELVGDDGHDGKLEWRRGLVAGVVQEPHAAARLEHLEQKRLSQPFRLHGQRGAVAVASAHLKVGRADLDCLSVGVQLHSDPRAWVHWQNDDLAVPSLELWPADEQILRGP